MISNKKRKEYLFIKYDGSYSNISSLPNYQEVNESDLANRPYILILDNNVCIHVSDSNISTQCQSKKTKAKNLLKYIRSSNITVNPTWGLLERAGKPGTFILDKNKLKDFENIFWRQLNQYPSSNTLFKSVDSIDSMKAILYPIYMYLLKIKLIISKNKCTVGNAKENLTELCDFMNNMQLFPANIWQLALAIIGGDSSANKFIKHGQKKKRDIFKDMWGAAWDIYYLQLPHLFYGLNNINNQRPQLILVTDDYDCARLGSLMKVIGNVDYGNINKNQTLTSFDFPYWRHRDAFLFELSWKVNNEISKRAIKRNYLSKTKLQSELESIIHNSSCQILQLTQELKCFYDKGFGF